MVRVSIRDSKWGGYWFNGRANPPQACAALYSIAQAGGSFPAAWILYRVAGRWRATAVGGWDEKCLRARQTRIPSPVFRDVFGFTAC
jgi:hypothetical protein